MIISRGVLGRKEMARERRENNGDGQSRIRDNVWQSTRKIKRVNAREIT